MSALNELVDWLSPLPETPAWAILLVKATVLLAVAWMIHYALARANPRWRVLLWRSAAVALCHLTTDS